MNDRRVAQADTSAKAEIGVLAQVGSLFFVTLELVQRLLLEDLAGYQPLRAHGELVVTSVTTAPFRPWLLMILPALGVLLGGAHHRSPGAGGLHVRRQTK